MENGPKNPTKVSGFKLRVEIVMPPAPTNTPPTQPIFWGEEEDSEETTQDRLAKFVAESAKKVEK